MRAVQESGVDETNVASIVFYQLSVHAVVMPVSTIKWPLGLREGPIDTMRGSINCAYDIRKFRPFSNLITPFHNVRPSNLGLELPPKFL